MQRRGRLLAALLLLFLSWPVTRTDSDNLRGVCAEGECTEVDSCFSVHRDDYDSYRNQPISLIEDPPLCDVNVKNCSKYQCSPGSCQHASQELWPHLNFTLKHYNQDNYGITVSWEQPDNVTGYVLLIKNTPVSAGNCGGGVTGLYRCECQHITDPSTTAHTQTRYYPDDSVRSRTLYIKLIPIPWCDGPSIMLPIPETCHNIRPGDCDTCGYQEPPDVSPPINIQWTQLPRLHGVLLTWEPGESYYDLPYPNMSFYLKVDRYEGKTFTPDITPRLEVLRRTNVTLQNLELYVNYSVKIRAYDCSCGYDWSSPVFIYLNESVPLPSSPTSLSPTLVVPPPSTTHLSTLSTTHLSTPSTTHLSTPSTTHLSTPSTTHLSTPSTTHLSTPSTTHLSTPSTTHLSTPTTLIPDPTDNHGMTVAGFTTLLTAVFVVITAGIAAIVAVVYRHMRKKHRRTPLSLNLPRPIEPNRHIERDQCPSEKLLQALPQRMKVLLLYSQETPQVQQEVILQLLMYELQKYCATKDGDRLLLEVVSYSSSAGQSSVPTWVENMVRDCDKVLCICNEEFKLEWEGKIRPLQGALVYCFKKLYLGTISRAEHKKYAIVLMNVAHEELIPSDYLRECKMFLCEKDAVKDIAQFVLEVPNHCLPHSCSLTPTMSTTSTATTPTSTWESTDDRDCVSLA